MRPGTIDWTLGGRASSFAMGRGASFWLQHDAHMLAPNRISLFDDEAGPPFKAASSRGLILALDLRRRTARVARQYRRPGTTLAQSEGSVQPLANGNAFVGFGSTEFFSEFSPTGKLVFDASLPKDDGSYREYRVPWSATPTTKPDIAARKRTAGSGVDVYASWNGATTVARWQVLGGASAGSLTPVTTAGRHGFETHIALSASPAVIAVKALDGRGHVLAESRKVNPS